MPELRYRFTATLKALTHIRIGDGGVLKDRVENEGREGDAPTRPEVASVFVGEGKRPYLPATSLKGWLRAYAEPLLESDCFERLFGYQKPGTNGAAGLGRGAMLRCFDSFHEANPVVPADGSIGDYWCPGRRTCVACHVVIDRLTKTASRNLLFFEEFVPAGSTFTLTFELLRPVCEEDAAHFEKDAASFLVLLKQFENSAGGPARLGSSSVDDWGRVQLTDLKVRSVDEAGLKSWLRKSNFGAPPFRDWSADQVSALAGKAQLNVPAPLELLVPITIEFEGGFICNDPSRTRKHGEPENEKGNFEPSRTPDGRPYLPPSSLRGSLRSQAEKILSTRLQTDVMNPAVPAGKPGSLPIVQDLTDCAGVDPVSLLFGAPGLRSAIHFRNQRTNHADKPVVHELVGLDRFSGAVGKRKFKARYFWQPTILVDLVVDLAALKWASQNDQERQSDALVLLAQALRDLAEGLIPLGFGTAKGWGRCKATLAPATGIDSIPAASPARAFLADGFVPQPLAKIPIELNLATQRSVEPGVDRFFNPYHFHPATPPDLQGAPTLEDLKSSTAAKLTLDRYHDGLFTGYLDCMLTAETPFAVGGKQTPRPHQPTRVELFKRNWNGVDEITIPGTSIRGMVSSHFEALTHSAMRVLDDDYYSVRKKMQEGLSAIGLVLRFGDDWFIKPLCLPTFNLNEKSLHPAWKTLLPDPVLKVYNGNTKEEIEKPAWIAANPTWTPGSPLVSMGVAGALTWNRAGTDVAPLAAIRRKPGKNPGPSGEYRIAEEKGSVPCSGILRTLGRPKIRQMPNGKEHELFIPAATINADFQNATPSTPGLVPLPSEVVRTFERIAGQMTDQYRSQDGQNVRPYEPIGTRPSRVSNGKGVPLKLQAGDLVYFNITDSVVAPVVREISFSSIWRQEVPFSAFGFFGSIHRDLLPMSDVRRKDRDDRDVPITPAEKLLGFVEMREKPDDESPLKTLASRLRFSDGIYTNNLGANPCYDTRRKWKILSTPKPPSTALYFYNSTGDPYIQKIKLGKEETHTPKGRKFYLHHAIAPGLIDSDDAPWCSQKPEDDKDNDQRMSVAPVKAGAEFRFRIHFENLTCQDLNLLYTSLRPTPEARYKLGLGRPLGLGTVRLDPSPNAKTVRVCDRYTPANLRQHLADHLDPLALSTVPLADTAFLALTAVKYSGVEYPCVSHGDGETRLFEWFVANDGDAHAAMRPLLNEDSAQPLRVLDYTPPGGDH